VSDGKCVDSGDNPSIRPLCLPGQQTVSGECCILPLVPDPFKCALPTTPQAPPKTPSTIPTPPDSMILFQQDHPAAGERDKAKVLTADGAAALASVQARLKASPGTKVRLIARASSEGATPYNQALAGRRLAFVVSALGLPAGAFADPTPDDGAHKGCQPVSTGQWSCGEVQADQSAANPSDRNVQVSFVAPTAGTGASETTGGGQAPARSPGGGS
jgi:hypothetical protein